MEKQGKKISAAVGKIIAEARNSINMTQSELADTLRLQRTSISNIESGNQVLLLDVFYDICEILKLNPGDVLNQATSNSRHIEDIEKFIQQTQPDETN
jgi:transcriptional regulator with XRE-family HTH domain